MYEEFFVQGDMEIKLGLPISYLNSRETINLAQSQTVFIDLIIQPFFETFSTFLPKINIHIVQVKENLSKWTSIISECEKLKEDGNLLLKKFNELEEEEEIIENHKNNNNKRTADILNNV